MDFLPPNQTRPDQKTVNNRHQEPGIKHRVFLYLGIFYHPNPIRIFLLPNQTTPPGARARGVPY